jgi:DNA-binding GntR family transcriptional regulator
MLDDPKISGALQPLDREPLSDQILSQIREKLFAGEFEPGQRLVLREIASQLGISITPVRDALTRLIAGGVLYQGPRNSAIVPELTVDSLKDLIIVRSELEGRAAREAALRCSAEEIKDLRKTMQKMQGLIKGRSLHEYLGEHRKFHFGVYKIAKIPILFEMIESLWLRCGPILTFVVPNYVLSLKGTDHHLKILGALETKDALTAERETIADIEEAGSYLLSLAGPDGYIRRP